MLITNLMGRPSPVTLGKLANWGLSHRLSAQADIFATRIVV
jgi:hypothetical protein